MSKNYNDELIEGFIGETLKVLNIELTIYLISKTLYALISVN